MMSMGRGALLSWLLFGGAVGCSGAPSTPSEVITPEEVRAVFIRRSVCLGSALTAGLAGILADVDGSPAAASRELACGRSTETCEAFLACSGVDAATMCDPAMFARRCDGAVLETCSRQRVRRQDCAADDDGNTICEVDEAGQATCATGRCLSSGLTCVEDVIVSCTGGVERYVEDCTLAGRACRSLDDRAACVERPTFCTMDQCEGEDVLLRCNEDFGFDSIRCAARLQGGRCEVVDGVARCVPDGEPCEVGAAVCEGAVARFCVDGAWLDLDCGSFLDATCDDTDGMIRCLSVAWPG